MLQSVRRPYLDVNSNATHFIRRPDSASKQLGSEQSWPRSRSLTNEERDEIDLQARTILSRCANKVKEMEALEKRKSDAIHPNDHNIEFSRTR
jgi:syntaxin 18